MANIPGLLKIYMAVCFITTLLIIISSGAVDASGVHQYRLGWIPTNAGSGCDGSIAECVAGGDEEFELDSEINRRILATSRYISYNALQRNRVPCSRRGASYYNCQPGAQANPYSRGCSTITRCRNYSLRPIFRVSFGNSNLLRGPP